MLVVVHPGRTPRDAAALREVADDGTPGRAWSVPAGELSRAVRAREDEDDAVRWVWADTAGVYRGLLRAGVRVERAHDLRLCRAILRRSTCAAGSALRAEAPGPWDAPAPQEPPAAPTSLFDELPEQHAPAAEPDPVAELRSQLEAVAGSTEPGRLRLLLAAESTGALLAAEMHADGMPWDAATHDALLTELLGPRPLPGARPARLESLAAELRRALVAPTLNPDSQPDLLRALRLAGFDVASTRRSELRTIEDPVRDVLLEYRSLSRLLSANGWAWMDQWVHDGRFRPDYVVGGVVSGRWATSGGGALQLPAQVRGAVRADPGWRLVVADAAQLEPRVLAAMSGDAAMAAAARGADLYEGVVAAGIVATRSEAKYAMLGAIYGATTGASAALMPRLERAYPRAVALVEQAARAGERGEVVTTWLGRSSPRPGEAFLGDLRAAAGEGAGAEEVRAARRHARDWGRFTRNFVVQGTAAEWALCWMASLRRRLRALEGDEGRPHLVFFLHDEVMVHTPAVLADEVAAAVREAAVEAGRLLFGGFPVEFALQVAVVGSYDEAK